MSSLESLKVIALYCMVWYCSLGGKQYKQFNSNPGTERLGRFGTEGVYQGRCSSGCDRSCCRGRCCCCHCINRRLYQFSRCYWTQENGVRVKQTHVCVVVLLLSMSSGVWLAKDIVISSSSFLSSPHFCLSCVLYPQYTALSVFCCSSPFLSHSFQISDNASNYRFCFYTRSGHLLMLTFKYNTMLSGRFLKCIL